jgi:hypothetical protein
MRSPHLPGLPTVSALMLTATIAAALGIFGPFDLEKMRGWQTLIAAAIAAAVGGFGAYVAVRNVKRQIRIGILGREEDRIERELPGLRDARDFCSRFLIYRVIESFDGITDAFADDGYGVKESTPQEDVLKALPNTDQATRQIVETRLQSCFRWAFHADRAFRAIKSRTEDTREPNLWAPGELDKVQLQIQQARAHFTEMDEGFRKSIDQLEDTVRSLGRKIGQYEARSARIRKEIEAYFDEEE